MYNQDIIIIDTETTGRSTRGLYEAVQLAAIRLDGKTLVEKASFNSLIRPERPEHFEPMAMKIHGLSMDKLLKAPSHKEVAAGFTKAMYGTGDLGTAVKGAMLAAHNAKFDWDFFTQIIERGGMSGDSFGYHIFDLWSVALDRCALLGLVPPGGKYSLQNLAEMFNLKRPAVHDALADVRVTAEVFRQLTAKIGELKRGSAKESPARKRS